MSRHGELTDGPSSTRPPPPPPSTGMHMAPAGPPKPPYVALWWRPRAKKTSRHMGLDDRRGARPLAGRGSAADDWEAGMDAASRLPSRLWPPSDWYGSAWMAGAVEGREGGDSSDDQAPSKGLLQADLHMVHTRGNINR